MSVAQTLDFLLDEAKRRGAVPIAFLLEPDAYGQLESEWDLAQGFLAQRPPGGPNSYRGLPIERQERGKGITIRTIV